MPNRQSYILSFLISGILFAQKILAIPLVTINKNLAPHPTAIAHYLEKTNGVVLIGPDDEWIPMPAELLKGQSDFDPSLYRIKKENLSNGYMLCITTQDHTKCFDGYSNTPKIFDSHLKPENGLLPYEVKLFRYSKDEVCYFVESICLFD